MILVDTHAVIWLTEEQSLLSAAAKTALIEARAQGDLAIADITLSEIAFLVTRKRVIVGTSLIDYLSFVEALFKVLPINGQIADQALRFGPAYPKDPADKLIGATANIYGARLVTDDRKIHRSGEVPCIW